MLLFHLLQHLMVKRSQLHFCYDVVVKSKNTSYCQNMFRLQTEHSILSDELQKMSIKQIDKASISATLTNLHILPVEILKSAKFTDVTLICGESKIGAHRIVLAARSGYFQEYFKRNPQATEITLDADFDDLKCILLYLYQGVIVIRADRRASFLQLAKQLSVTIDEKNMFEVRTRMENFAGNGKCG